MSYSQAGNQAVQRAFRLPVGGLVVALCALVASLALALVVGASDIALSEVLLGLADALPGLDFDHGLTATERSILLHWRLPRAVLGALVGASLALSGSLYQGVFRNPLADPYLLGVAAGAGLGATIAIVNDWAHQWGPISAVAASAFIGALLATAVAAAIGYGTSRAPTALLLAGVAVASFFTALQTYIMQRNTDSLAEVYSWILGRLGTFGWSEVGLIAPYMAFGLLVALLARRSLDLLQIGDEEAMALGVSINKVRFVLIITASLLAAAAVSVSGLISFVGIIVPHFVRLVYGYSYRIVLPFSALAGAGFLVLADVGARTLTEGSEVPIGVITAFLGAPFFGFIMWHRREILR